MTVDQRSNDLRHSRKFMDIQSRISQNFIESIEEKKKAQATLVMSIAEAIQTMVTSLQRGNKILACGNGGSAADAQHFSAELLNRFERERHPLAALALTTDSSTLTSIGNDYDFAQIFSRQIKGLGREGAASQRTRVKRPYAVAWAADVSQRIVTGTVGDGRRGVVIAGPVIHAADAGVIAKRFDRGQWIEIA